MKASEFFKKVGIEAVKSYIVAYEDHLTDELKRLVESNELIEKLGGMEKCKMLIVEYGNSESAAHLSYHVENVESCHVD